IKHDNSLAKNVTDYRAKDRVNIVVTNPPFGGTIKDGIEMNFPADLRTKETADLFLILIMHILKQGGRCGMVLPDGFLFGEGAKTRIKEKLLSEFNLHTIVRLPNGVFSPYTDINTNLLFFEKGSPTKEIWFFEHPLPEGYKKYTKTKPIRNNEFNLEKEWWSNRKDNEYAWKVTIDKVKEKNYNLDFKNPLVIEKEQEYNSDELINKINEKLVFTKQLLEHIKKNI
ncbi:SAM-dependent DNA methyltransferase, partial [bacterium]